MLISSQTCFAVRVAVAFAFLRISMRIFAVITVPHSTSAGAQTSVAGHSGERHLSDELQLRKQEVQRGKAGMRKSYRCVKRKSLGAIAGDDLAALETGCLVRSHPHGMGRLPEPSAAGIASLMGKDDIRLHQ
jgi:hypothetical protein